MTHRTTWIPLALWLLLGTTPAEGDHHFVGADKCKTCHKKELIGNQYGVWLDGPHHRAYLTLRGEAAQAVAAERGLAVPPHEADDCLRCHTTSHGVPPERMANVLVPADSVQCESCHGPGADYRKKKIMSDRDKSIAAGMWEPGNEEKVCLTCHNDESPTWDAAKGFDYAAAKKKIAHPIPEDVKGRYIELEKEARKKRGGSDEEK